MIEVDVQQSKPDQDEVYGGLVVIHDSTINRTTTSQGRVSSYTLEQLGNMTMRSPKKQINQNILGKLANLQKIEGFEAVLGRRECPESFVSRTLALLYLPVPKAILQERFS